MKKTNLILYIAMLLIVCSAVQAAAPTLSNINTLNYNPYVFQDVQFSINATYPQSNYMMYEYQVLQNSLTVQNTSLDICIQNGSSQFQNCQEVTNRCNEVGNKTIFGNWFYGQAFCGVFEDEYLDDGDFNTFDYQSPFAGSAYFEFSYKKVNNMLNTSVLRAKWYNRDQNYSIPNDCFNYFNDSIYFRFNTSTSAGTTYHADLNCYNGTWKVLDSDTAASTISITYFYEKELYIFIGENFTTDYQFYSYTGNTFNPNDNISISFRGNDGLNYSDWQNQSWIIQPLEIGPCNSTLNWTILNMSYYDQISGANINATNYYNLNWTYNEVNYGISGSFTDEYSNQLCTNVNNSQFNVSLNITGEFILSKTGYANQRFKYETSNAIQTNNYDATNLSLSLISLSNSTTMLYQWFTSSYQPIDGLMEIYKCNNDGSETLVESKTVSGGEVSANIVFDTQEYKYILYVDGETQTAGSWSQCHIETSTPRIYYVEIGVADVLPVIGLFLVDCRLTKVGTSSVTMTWNSNPHDSSSIEGCIVGKRSTIRNYTEIYRNCTNASSGNFSVTIPSNGNDYLVLGQIIQDGITGYCRDEIYFYTDTDSHEYFGPVALFGAVLLIMSIVLVYSNNRISNLAAAGFGLVGVSLIGIINLPAGIIIGICSLLIIVLVIARNSRQ